MLLLFNLISGCSTPNDADATIYVILDSTHSETFLNDLSILSRAQGMTPVTGSATPDAGPTLHVLEARGNMLRLWAQNIPLSAGECGSTSVEATVDPYQFFVSVTPILSLPLQGRAEKAAATLAAALVTKKYRVITHGPSPCSSKILKGVAVT